MRRVILSALATAGIAAGSVATPAHAAPVISQCTSGASCVSGTTNVNLGAFTNSNIVTGTVGMPTGPLVTFDSITQGNLSTNPGAATVFLANGDLLNSLFIQILAGFTAAEFNLENGSPASFNVNLTTDLGGTFNQTVSRLQGSNIFTVTGTAGEVFTSITLSSDTAGAGFRDLKQLRVVPRPGAVPEPGTWAMMLLGFAGMGTAARRSRRKNLVLLQIA